MALAPCFCVVTSQNGVEPNLQRLVRVLEDGPRRNRGLVPAVRALDKSWSPSFPATLSLAPPASKTMRPAQPSQVLPTALFAGDPVYELVESARIVVDA